MNIRERLTDIACAALIALLLGASLTLTLLGGVSVEYDMRQVVTLCAATAVLLALLCFNKATKLSGAVLAAAAILWIAYKNAAIVEGLRLFFEALFSFDAAALAQYRATIAPALAIVLTLLAFALSRLAGGAYPAATLMLFSLLFGWFVGAETEIKWLLPGLVALILMLSRSQQSEGAARVKALPIALAVVLIGAALTPVNNPTWPPLEQAAEKARKLFEDYFLFNDPRTAYSVSEDGYQPLIEALGGPADPDNSLVMTVETDDKLLLRGSIKRTYTGRAWTEPELNSRYLLLDPLKSGLRDEIFGVSTSGAFGSSAARKTVRVALLGGETSTLFVPHYMTNLSLPLDIAAYFNDIGEVFITRPVQAGDEYTFTAYLPTEDEAELEARALSAAKGTDDEYARALQGYTGLPDTIDGGVYQLVRQLTAGAVTPYEKAAILRDYLKSNYAYTLDVAYAPSGADFVSYFLLESGEGYCTYFATAMAVMARIAGMPSRYVEGYLVNPDASGLAYVTGADAHAWVEIYFDGLGWLTFDATPAGSERGDSNGGDDHADHTPAPAEPTAAPTPEATAAPEATPTPEAASYETPTPAPEEALLESPPPEDAAPSTPPDAPEDGDSRRNRVWPWLLLALLLALAVWLTRRRLMATTPQALAKRANDNSTRALIWYRAMLQVLRLHGQQCAPEETPAEFAARLAESGEASEAFVKFADELTRARYSRADVSPETLELAERAYARLESKLSLKERLRWRCLRALKGVGDIDSIP